jgi:hypothetical protein
LPEEELKNSLLFFVSHRGIPISGMSCYSSEKRLRVGRIFSRRRAAGLDNLERIVFSGAARRIVYELCKFGVKGRFSTLDLGGVDFADPLKVGITNFKLSFGGAIVPVKIGRYSKPAFEEKLPMLKAMGLDIT